jgi:hypothetical protein
MIWKVIGRWALMVIAVPLAAAGARKLSTELESRRGRSRTSRLLGSGADVLQRFGGRSRRRRRWR